MAAVTRRRSGFFWKSSLLLLVVDALVACLLEGRAMFAGSHFASQSFEIRCNLVISPACVMILGVRQDFANEQTQFS